MLCVFVSEYVLDGILGVFSIKTLCHIARQEY